MSPPPTTPTGWVDDGERTRCPICMVRAMRPTIIDYRAPDVHVPELHAYECSHCGEQMFGNTADDEIREAISKGTK